MYIQYIHETTIHKNTCMSTYMFVYYMYIYMCLLHVCTCMYVLFACSIFSSSLLSFDVNWGGVEKWFQQFRVLMVIDANCDLSQCSLNESLNCYKH